MTNETNKPKSDLEKRNDRVMDWLRCAKYVADKSDDPEAKEILDFLRQNAVVGTVKEGKKARYDYPERSKNPKDYVAILVLDKDDPQELLEFNSLGSYLRNTKMITLRGINLPIVYRGLILLHEGSHALKHHKDVGGINQRPKNERIEEELKVWEMEKRLVENLGDSDSLKKFFNIYADRMLDFQKKTNNRHKWKVGIDNLDKILGIELTEDVKNGIYTIIGMIGIFTAIEKRNTSIEDQRKEKLETLLRFSNYS